MIPEPDARQRIADDELARLDCVAVVEGNDKESITLIGEILKEKGIVSYTEGSVVFGIFVSKSDSNKACQVLQSSAQLRDKGIKLRQEDGSW